MAEHDPAGYGERIAPAYEDIHANLFDEAVVGPAADFLAELAGSGPALELGIGTGRIALPLAAKGVEVHGLDASQAMVAKLREKPGGDKIPVTMGDFANVQVEGSFALVYVVFNTFFGLLAEGPGVVFPRVAAHLKDGGCFLVEAFVPDMRRIAPGQHVGVIGVDEDQVHLDVSRYDLLEQRASAARVTIGESGIRLTGRDSVRLALRARSDG